MKMSFAVIVGGALIVFLAVVMAVVFIPGWVWDPPQTVAAHPYTAQQARGHQLYFSNGCDYCHTQYVRYFDADYTGPVSQGGNYMFDKPPVLGSERTGPDLSYIGRKRDFVWEVEHLKDPRQYSPMSLMPSFDFLPQEDLEALGAYLFALGDEVAAEWMILPPVDYTGHMDPLPYPKVTPVPSGTSQGWPTFIASGLMDGKELYITHCQTCHGCSGNGLGTYAGTKQVTPANFKAEPIRSMPDDQWFWHVSEGVPGTVMPPWKESLSEEQRWLAIRYVQQIFAQPKEHDPDEGDVPPSYANTTNPLPQTVETLDHGKHIFIRECWVCHGDAGRGEGPYGDLIRPVPPDFSAQADYAAWTDADYFWRISEGVPWSAMPVWKHRYNEDERWSVVYYIQVNFTQTSPRPPTGGTQEYPPIYEAQTAPVDLTADQVVTGNNSQLVYASPNAAMGKSMFAQMCAHCHGLAGLGDGWDGQYLDPRPANFADPDVQGLSDGDFFARISYGLQDSAMPAWGEWMPLQNRWNVIKYIADNITGKATAGPGTVVPSVMDDGAISILYLGMSRDLWMEEVGPVSPTHGAAVYQQFCAPCHGDNGQGLPQDQTQGGLGWPAPLPSQMDDGYLYWRIHEGVPDTLMPPFSALLKPEDIWDLISFLNPQ